MTIRDRVNYYCKQKDITQKELAEKVGTSTINIAKVIAGEFPSLRSLTKIAETLDIPVVKLLEDEKEAPKLCCPKCGIPLKLVGDE